MMWNKGRHPALEGAHYFRATNATMGTGVAMGIVNAYSATASVLFVMENSGARTVIPHYIRLINTAAGASTTSSHCAIAVDRIARYASGGTDLTARIAHANSGVVATSSVDVLRYNCTAAAAGTDNRIVGRAALKTQASTCWVVGDEVFMVWGEEPVGGTLSGTGPQRIIVPFAPIALGGADHSLCVHMWNVANATTAPSWEFEMAWWEI